MNRLASQPESITVGPLHFSLTPSPRGPHLEAEDDEQWMSFIWLVEAAVAAAEEEQSEEAYQALIAGSNWFHEIMEFREIYNDYDDLHALRTQWQSYVNAYPDPELRVIRVASYETVLLPQELIAEFTKALRHLWHQHAVPAPWLFCTDPCGPAHQSEHNIIMAAEQLINEHPQQVDLAALGLHDCGDYALTRLQQLLQWQASHLARTYIKILDNASVLPFPAQAPWLFSASSHHHQAHPDEQEILQVFESEAADIDAWEQSLDGSEEPESLIKKRRALLAQLHNNGLLERSHQLQKEHYLNRWQFLHLSDYYRAACKFCEYVSSHARKERLAQTHPDVLTLNIQEAPVCLDIFRGLTPPEHVHTWDWIAWGEYLLLAHGPADNVQADQGHFPYHDQDGLIHILWRRDGNKPALRYIKLITD